MWQSLPDAAESRGSAAANPGQNKNIVEVRFLPLKKMREKKRLFHGMSASRDIGVVQQF